MIYVDYAVIKIVVRIDFGDKNWFYANWLCKKMNSKMLQIFHQLLAHIAVMSCFGWLLITAAIPNCLSLGKLK